MTIKNFKTIIISANVKPGAHGDLGTTFSIPIFLPFIPSHFIVKAVNYCIITAAATSTNILLLKTSLLNNEPILSITRLSGAGGTSEIYTSQLDTKFKMNPGVVNGNYDFTLSDIYGVSPDQFTNLQFALTIEFVEEI